MATIHDVAKLAGVGSGTASRALGGSGPVAAETRAKVQEAARKLGYKPSSAARALSRRQQGLIGVLTPQFDGSFFGQLLGLAEQQIRAAGKHLMVASVRGSVPPRSDSPAPPEKTTAGTATRPLPDTAANPRTSSPQMADLQTADPQTASNLTDSNLTGAPLTAGHRATSHLTAGLLTGDLLTGPDSSALTRAETAALAFLDERDCDGLILLGSRLSERELILCAERRPALALLNRQVPTLAGQCFSVDHEAAGRDVARQLLAEGHRRFSAITGPTDSADAMARHTGFLRALTEAGCAPPPALIADGRYTFSGGLAAAAQLLDSGQPFTACFCGNDEMAISANHVFQTAGRRIAVFGYDNTAALAFSGLPVSSVQIPLEEMMQSACAFVLNQCYGSTLPVRHSFRHQLVLRHKS